jgi:hypothetical protein
MCSTRPLSRSSDTFSLLLHSTRNAPRGSKTGVSGVVERRSRGSGTPDVVPRAGAAVLRTFRDHSEIPASGGPTNEPPPRRLSDGPNVR